MAATVAFAFNVWEHLPVVTPSHYSDVASIFWREGIGKGSRLIPYYDFAFEYPVIVGVIVYVCTAVRIFIPDFSTVFNYYALAMDAILYPFAMGTVTVLYKMCKMLGVEKHRILKFFVITPSFLMFTVYNWDIIAIFFSTLSIYLFLKGMKKMSAVSLGLGIGAKLFPIVLLPVYLLEEKSWKQRLALAFISVGTFTLLNAPFIILNFSTWFETWTYHMRWGIEDSWLIYLFHQMDPNAHYASLAVFLYLVYKGLIETSKKEYVSQSQRVLERSFLMNLAWLIGSYVVTPQMALMLLPFMVLLPLIAPSLFYLADALNALIIVMWFTPQLNFGNPLIASSPVQAVSAARQLLWLSFFLYCIYPKQIAVWMRGLFKRIEK